MRFSTHFVMGFGLLLSIGSVEVSAGTTAREQRELVEALSGVAPAIVSQRFSDSPEIQTTAQYLKSQYDAAGITAEVMQYDPSAAFPYYFQMTDKTYRAYFKHMLPMLQSDFDGLCEGILTPDQTQVVLKRLARVALDQTSLCRTDSRDRVELYISTTVAYSTGMTKKMLDSRTLATWPNVVAYVSTSGSFSWQSSRPVCVIGAHMDSVAREGGGRGPITSPGTPAPGADDNASGTAAVLTLAREFRDSLRTMIHQRGYKDPGCDLAFVHFSGEEEGLLGSIVYSHIQEQRPIKWMVNFDMIGFNGASQEPAWNIGYDKAFGLALPEAFRVPGMKAVLVERDAFIYSSDQIAFWDIGVPAISIGEQSCAESACLEPFKYFNPHLHTPADDAAILDFGYDAAIVNQSYEGLMRLLYSAVRS